MSAKGHRKQSHRRMEEHIRTLERELYHLWGFIGNEGLWEEAKDYVDEHRSEITPFEW